LAALLNQAPDTARLAQDRGDFSAKSGRSGSQYEDRPGWDSAKAAAVTRTTWRRWCLWPRLERLTVVTSFELAQEAPSKCPGIDDARKHREHQ